MSICMLTLAFVPSHFVSAASSSSYWIKVNRQENVATVYQLDQDKMYQPLKAFLCSCGKPGHETPLGTSTIGNKLRWSASIASAEYMQYFTQFNGDVGFHSTCYLAMNPSTLEVEDHNQLGQAVSHGCVRLHLKDARWIYENCPPGTKVTVYESSDPGPLGRPALVKAQTSYDPTDRNHRQTYALTGPVIKIRKNKISEVTCGTAFFAMAGVTAKDPYTNEDLTDKVQVQVARYHAGSYVDQEKLDTDQPGRYRLQYSCRSRACGDETATATFYVTVKAQD